MSAPGLILAMQAFASVAMCGLIWFVQIVHYPLFRHVGTDAGHAYSHAHRHRTPPVVIPPMLVEGVTAALIALFPPPGISPVVAWAGVLLVLALWGSTAWVQMPLHDRLGREGLVADVVDALVRSNWVRTFLWTARAVLAIWMLATASRA